MAKTNTNYETIFVCDCSKGEDAIKALVEKFTDLIKANGEITEVNEWGKRRLAYPINDMNEGYYVFVTFSAPQAFVAELYRIFNITDGILRSIVVKADEKASMPARVQETVAEAVVEEAPAAEAVAEEAAE
ncbi:MAG: 30S ribosomal protein S6 [Ruminococcaceae bacterium]|nr:30S ribosomal protein S6 [Oscillospiraceae bacterium]